MVRLLQDEVPANELKKVQRADENRRRVASEGIIACYSASGQQLALPENLLNQPVRRAEDAVSHEARVLVVQSVVWGFDLWYRAAPIVVSYASRLQKVTVGCPDVPTAERLFGPGGLNHVWKVLGRGWGGRESIGGSPRGVSLDRGTELPTRSLIFSGAWIVLFLNDDEVVEALRKKFPSTAARFRFPILSALLCRTTQT